MDSLAFYLRNLGLVTFFRDRSFLVTFVRIKKLWQRARAKMNDRSEAKEQSGKSGKSILMHQGVLPFVQVVARYVLFAETSKREVSLQSGLEELCGLLAQLYTTAWSLPDLPLSPYLALERHVGEEDYERVRQQLAEWLGEQDMYLDTQIEEMKYSDRPISISSAESLADLYQMAADFAWIFRNGVEANMVQAVAEVKYGFQHEWASPLLATLRHLHQTLYSLQGDMTDMDMDFNLEEWEE